MIVDELIAILGFDLKGEGELNKFKNGLDDAEKKASAFVAVITKLGLAAAAGFAAIGGTAAAVSFGKGFVRDITNTGREFENFGVRLKALEGSSEGAEKAMKWIRQFAIETPLELSQVVDAFANMRAFGMDPMNGSLRAIVDAMAATGGGAEKLDGIVLALGQAWTKGKLQGEEAMQLLERGVPVWELLGQATGKNAAQLQELASKGKLGRKEIQLLIDALGKKYLGASEDAAKTFDGILSNLTDNWTNWLLAISEAGYYDDLKRRMQGLLGWVNGLWENGFADRSAQRISDFLVSAMTNASHLAMQAYRIGAGFASAAMGVNRLISSVTGLDQTMTAAGIGAAAIASSAWGRGALMAVARRIPAVAALLALDDIVSGLNGDDSLIGSTEEGRAALDRLKKSLTDLDAAATAFAANLGSVRASIVQNLGMPAEAFSTWDDAKVRWEAFKADFSKPVKIGGLEVDFASGPFAQVETWAQNAATNFRLLFTSPTELAVKLMTEAVDRVAGAFERVGQVFSALSAPIETAKSIIQQLMDAVGSLKSIVDQVLGGENPTVTEDARPSPTGEALTPAPDGGLIVHQTAEIVPAKEEVPAQERQPPTLPETQLAAPASAPQTPTPTASPTVVEPRQSVTRPAAPVAQPRPAAPQPASTPMADLVRTGLQQVEGLSVEFNLSEEQIREKVNGLMSFINSATATAKAMLDITQVIAPANQARAAMSDLERTYTARIDADTSPLMAKLAQAKTAINDFRSSVGGGMAAGGMPPARIAAGNSGT